MVTKRVSLNELKSLVKQIVKEEQMLNEGLPTGKSKVAQEAAQTLNYIIGKINRPDLNREAGVLASKIISLIEQDQSI